MDAVLLRALLEAQDNSKGVVDAFERRLDAATKKQYQPVVITAQTDTAQQQIKHLQAGVTSLTNKPHNINVNVNTSAANQQLRTLENRLESLQRQGYYNMAAGASLTAAFTAPLIAGTVAVSKAAIDWESSFAGVRKTVNGTEADLQRIANQLREMAAGPNPIPIDVNELNKIAESAGQLGIATPNIARFTRTVADMGVATNMTTEQAATSMARLANITQMPQTQFDRLGSTVVDLGNKFATTEAEIMSMSLRIAGAGKQVGLSEPQILAFAAGLSSVGLRADAGGSSISRMFITLDSATREGGEKLETIGRVAGTTGEQFKKAFQQDAAGALLTFITGMKRVGDEGGNVFSILKELGLNEIRVRDAVLRAANAGDLLASAIRTGTDAWRENNALTTEAERRYATTASQLQILKNRALETAITMGEQMLPRINEVADAAGTRLPHAIQVLIDTWEGLPAPVQTALKYFLMLVALAGPMKMLSGHVMILVSALGSLASLTGLSSVIGAFANGGFASGAGMAALTAAVPGLVASLAALVAVVGAGAIAWEVFKTRVDEAVIAQHNLQVNSENLQRSLDFTRSIAAGNNRATQLFDKLSEKVSNAGEDVGKLESTLKTLSDARHEVKNLGLSPAAEQIFRNQIDRMIRDIEARKISLDVEPGETWKQIVDRGLFGRDASTSDYVGAAISPLGLVGGNAVRSGWSWLTGGGKSTPAPTQPQGAGWNGWSQSTAGTASGMFTAPGVQATQQNAQKVIDINKATYAQLQQILDDYNKKAAAGQQLTWTEQRRFEEAKSRRDAAISSGRDAAAKARLAEAQAKADAAEAEKKLAEETAERLRRIEMQALQSRVQMWQSFGNQAEGVLGRIAQVAEQGSVVGEKTARARMEAEMLKRQYEGIPEPLRRAVVELAGIEYRMKRITETRDAWRGLFGDIARTLRQAGLSTEGLEKFAGGLQGRLGQGAEMRRLQGMAGQRGADLVNAAEGQRASAQSRIEVLQEAGRPSGEVYAAGGTGGGAGALGVAQKYLGMRGGDPRAARLLGSAYGQEWCAGFVRGVLTESGKTDWSKSNRVMDVRAWGQKQGLAYRGTPKVGDVFTVSRGGGRGHTGFVSGVKGDRFSTIAGNEGSQSNFQSRVKDNNTYNIRDAVFISTGAGASRIPAGSKAGQRVENTPALAPAVAPRRVGPIRFDTFDPRLMNSPGMPGAWGGEVSNSRMRPGESRQIQQAVQEFIRSEMAKGSTFSPEFLTKSRQWAGGQDNNIDKKKINDDAWESVRISRENSRAKTLEIRLLRESGKWLRDNSYNSLELAKAQKLAAFEQAQWSDGAIVAKFRADKLNGTFTAAQQVRRNVALEEKRLNEEMRQTAFIEHTARVDALDKAFVSLNDTTIVAIARRRMQTREDYASLTPLEREAELLREVRNERAKMAQESKDQSRDALRAAQEANDDARNPAAAAIMRWQREDQRRRDKDPGYMPDAETLHNRAGELDEIHDKMDTDGFRSMLNVLNELSGDADLTAEKIATAVARIQRALAGGDMSTDPISDSAQSRLYQQAASNDFGKQLDRLKEQADSMGSSATGSLRDFRNSQTSPLVLAQQQARALSDEMEQFKERAAAQGVDISAFAAHFEYLESVIQGVVNTTRTLNSEQLADRFSQMQDRINLYRVRPGIDRDLMRRAQELKRDKSLDSDDPNNPDKNRIAILDQERLDMEMSRAEQRVADSAGRMKDAIRAGLDGGFSSGLQAIGDRLKDRALDALSTYLTNRLPDSIIGMMGDNNPDAMRHRGGMPTTGGFAGPLGAVAPYVPFVRDMAGAVSGTDSPAAIAAQVAGAVSGGNGAAVFEGATFNNPRIIGGLPSTAPAPSGKPTDTQFLGAVAGAFMARRR